MPCALIRGKRMQAVLVPLLALSIGPVDLAIGADGQASLALTESLTNARGLADEGRHADALRSVIMALEAHPNELDHGEFDRVRRESFEWFGRVPQERRPQLLGNMRACRAEARTPTVRYSVS